VNAARASGLPMMRIELEPELAAPLAQSPRPGDDQPPEVLQRHPPAALPLELFLIDPLIPGLLMIVY
jgi:hypothetical protein